MFPLNIENLQEIRNTLSFVCIPLNLVSFSKERSSALDTLCSPNVKLQNWQKVSCQPCKICRPNTLEILIVWELLYYYILLIKNRKIGQKFLTNFAKFVGRKYTRYVLPNWAKLILSVSLSNFSFSIIKHLTSII